MSIAALRKLWLWRAPLAAAYLLLCLPSYLLSWSGWLDGLGAGVPLHPQLEGLTAGDLVLSLTYSGILLLLDALLILLLTRDRPRRPSSLAGQLAGAWLALLLVWVLRSLLLAVATLTVVLLPPVFVWFVLAPAVTIAERERNPFAALQHSRRLVSGRSVQVLLALAPVGLPLLAATMLLSPLGPGLPSWGRTLGNISVDLLGLALTAVTVELYQRLSGPTQRS